MGIENENVNKCLKRTNEITDSYKQGAVTFDEYFHSGQESMRSKPKIHPLYFKLLLAIKI